jgi:hypothetical protein
MITNEKEHYAELRFAIPSKEKRHLGTQLRSWTLLKGLGGVCVQCGEEGGSHTPKQWGRDFLG